MSSWAAYNQPSTPSEHRFNRNSAAQHSMSIIGQPSVYDKLASPAVNQMRNYSAYPQDRHSWSDQSANNFPPYSSNVSAANPTYGPANGPSTASRPNTGQVMWSPNVPYNTTYSGQGVSSPDRRQGVLQNDQAEQHARPISERFICQHCQPLKHTVCRSAKDLERHVKSVHDHYEPGDSYYVCPVSGCTRADKPWPRRDNFIAHITRMHPKLNPKELAAQSKRIVGQQGSPAPTTTTTDTSSYDAYSPAYSAADSYEPDMEYDNGGSEGMFFGFQFAS